MPSTTTGAEWDLDEKKLIVGADIARLVLFQRPV